VALQPVRPRYELLAAPVSPASDSTTCVRDRRFAGVWGAHWGTAEVPCPLEAVLPRITRLSLHPDGSFRDAVQHGLALCRRIAVVRFDGRLDYATLESFERGIDAILEADLDLRWVLIAGHTLEKVDAIAAEGLAELFERIRSSGRQVGVSGLREEVLALLERTGLKAAIGPENIFPTQERAIQAIHAAAHQGCDESACPLLEVVRVAAEPEPGHP
jgi:anti-anti-sigma regulatory factor